MLIYKYASPQGNAQIHVELLDTPFVNKWKGYLQRTADRLPNILWYFSSHGMAKQYISNPIPMLNELHTSFEFLQQHLSLDFSKEIADLVHLLEVPTDLKQTHLNTWHRHFTTIATEYYSGRMVIPQSIDINEMFLIFHALNQNVHDLEFMTYPTLSRRVAIGDKLQYSAFCADARELDGSNALWVSGHAEGITDSFDPEFEEYHYNVWINEDIQGKDHMKAWLDEDDLSKSDIWGNSFMTPNVMFDPHMIYASVIDNPEFMSAYKASNKKLNRWPLGSIVNDVDWKVIEQCKINSIELDGKVLWVVK